MAPKTKFKSPLVRVRNSIVKLLRVLRKPMNRANAAHLLMILFVSFTSVGAWLFAPPYGFITAGICSGIYGFLLGRE